MNLSTGSLNESFELHAHVFDGLVESYRDAFEGAMKDVISQRGDCRSVIQSLGDDLDAIAKVQLKVTKGNIHSP